MDLSQYKEWLLLRDKSPGTIKQYSLIVKIFYRDYKGDFAEYKRNLMQYSDGYRNFCINAIKSYYRFSGQEIDPEVMTRIRVRDAKQVLIPPDKVQSIVDSLKPHHKAGIKYKTDWRNYCLVGLLAYTGIRSSQLTRIRVSDIRFDGSIWIRGVKRESGHFVFPIPKLLHAIEKYISLQEFHGDERLFPILPGRVRDIVKPLTGYNPKDFRTTFAVEYLRRLRQKWGISDIRKVQKALGHISISSTEIYLKLLEESENNSSEVGMYEY
jgi:integrase